LNIHTGEEYFLNVCVYGPLDYLPKVFRIVFAV